MYCFHCPGLPWWKRGNRTAILTTESERRQLICTMTGLLLLKPGIWGLQPASCVLINPHKSPPGHAYQHASTIAPHPITSFTLSVYKAPLAAVSNTKTTSTSWVNGSWQQTWGCCMLLLLLSLLLPTLHQPAGYWAQVGSPWLTLPSSPCQHNELGCSWWHGWFYSLPWDQASGLSSTTFTSFGV